MAFFSHAESLNATQLRCRPLRTMEADPLKALLHMDSTMNNQIALPNSVREEEVARQKTLGDAIALCANVGGYSLDKELQMELGVDKAQFSRWQSGTEGVVWPKLERLMDACGNDAPLLWMLHARGYDLHSIRKLETETERSLRAAHDLLNAERLKVRVLTEALHGRTA